MNKPQVSQFAFASPRVFITLAFFVLGVLLVLPAFAIYPAGNALARQAQSSVQELEQDANTHFDAATPLLSSCLLTVLPNDGVISGNARAPNTNFRWGRAVYLITATELAASGFPSGAAPTTIGWNYQAGGVADSVPLTLYLQNTTDTTNTKSIAWTAAIAGMTMVHNAMTALPSTAGPFDITLSGGSPFTYTGGGLYVALDWGEYTGTLSTGAAAWCNSTGLLHGLLGAQSNNSVQPNLVASDFRPETRLNSSIQNDAAVTAIYSLGELPLGLVPAQTIKAVITNHGTNTLASLPVTLTITGADSFTDTQIIPSLAGCGGQVMVTFAAFTPAALGSDLIQVSVPSDDNAANNSRSKPLSITPFGYSYKYNDSISSGGAGLNGATTGALVARFTTTAVTSVAGVKLEFFAASATTYRVAIYGESGSGTPSTTPLFVDAADRTVTMSGPVTITPPSPVTVGPGNFCVGIQQTNTTNASLSFDKETPVRSGAFFLAVSLPVDAWVDFSPGNTFKLNVGVLLQAPGGTPAPTPTATPGPPTPTPGGTPTPTPNISGTIFYCSNPNPGPVPSVTLTLTGTSGAVTLTNGAGNYTFSGLVPGGNYVVTPSKTAVAPASNGIDGVDVLAVQRHFLNIALIPVGCRRDAADVNGDDDINGVDAVALQRFFLGLATGIANTGQYRFTPASRSYSPLGSNQTGQNYDALILGDIASSFVHRPQAVRPRILTEGNSEGVREPGEGNQGLLN